jgi:hypothetical protein
MVETPESFIVAVPAQFDEPNPAADPGGYAALQRAISRTIANDLETVFADAVRNRANPRINHANYDNIVQPQQ